MYPKEIFRYITGNYSHEDEEFVKKWLREDPSHKEIMEKIKNVWVLSDNLDIGDEDQAWQKLKQNTIEKEAHKEDAIVNKSHSGVDLLLKVAAVLLVVAGAYGFYMYSYSVTSESALQNKQLANYHSVSSDEGERVRVRIKDGTKVVLNASSRIYYGKDYGVNSRNIYLEGEAYFEVNNDHSQPFVVFTNGTRVEDISTKFNVKAYQEQGSTEIVVSEGMVKVSPKEQKGMDSKEYKDGPSVLLSEGQKVNVKDDAPNQLNVESANLNEALSWLQGQLVFNAEPLSEIVVDLESYYNIEIEVVDTTILNKRITASFDNESLDNVAKLLAISTSSDYSIKGDTLKFHSKSRTLNDNR